MKYWEILLSLNYPFFNGNGGRDKGYVHLFQS